MALKHTKQLTKTTVAVAPARKLTPSAVAAKREDLKRIHFLMGSIKYKQEEKKQLEQIAKAEMEELLTLMKRNRMELEEYGEFRAKRYSSRSPRVDPKKLLAAGVTVDVVAACTDQNPYDSVKITRLKGGDDDDDE